MIRRTLWMLLVIAALSVTAQAAIASEGYAATVNQNTQDWQRFYHYPYTYYPHNFYAPEYFRSSSSSMMQRYPAEMQIPKYRRDWQNFYPSPKRFYQGYGFKLDMF
ncbi:MAG: calmodulin-binding protein [Thermoguttaceae bacterium]|nr:calmodulin-binding protein [Thermoguttaceae bacterium]